MLRETLQTFEANAPKGHGIFLKLGFEDVMSVMSLPEK